MTNPSPTSDEELKNIIVECVTTYAAEYRMRNEAKDPYTIKIAENNADKAIRKCLAAIRSDRQAYLQSLLPEKLDFVDYNPETSSKETTIAYGIENGWNDCLTDIRRKGGL